MPQEVPTVEINEQTKTKMVQVEWGSIIEENLTFFVLEVPIDWDLRKMLGEWADISGVNSRQSGFDDERKDEFIKWLIDRGATQAKLETLNLGK